MGGSVCSGQGHVGSVTHKPNHMDVSETWPWFWPYSTCLSQYIQRSDSCWLSRTVLELLFYCFIITSHLPLTLGCTVCPAKLPIFNQHSCNSPRRAKLATKLLTSGKKKSSDSGTDCQLVLVKGAICSNCVCKSEYCCPNSELEPNGILNRLDPYLIYSLWFKQVFHHLLTWVREAQAVLHCKLISCL